MSLSGRKVIRTGKVGRPRHRYPGKWASWKRGQRDMPSRPGMIRHHKRPGTFGSPTNSNTILLSRSRHAALHNRLRKKR